MIKGNIKNFINHDSLSDNLKLGLKYLQNNDFSTVKNGKYEISGDAVFVIVQDYNSKPIEEGKFEAHSKYIDIQYIVKGQEQIGVGEINNFLQISEYDSEKDIVFLEPKNKEIKFVKLEENEFVIFYPNDVHMPSLSVENSSYVKKVVVKVIS